MLTKNTCCSMSSDEILNLENSNFRDTEVVTLLKLLAHPLRLKILRLLLYEEQICTCEIIPIFGASLFSNGEKQYKPESLQVQITKQLVKLRKEGILESRKITFSSEGEAQNKDDGKWTSYKISRNYYSILKNIIESFSKGKDEVKELINIDIM
jgi:DNA-binding transcriptional ArsR family regulator